jgi:hypothetical protein
MELAAERIRAPSTAINSIERRFFLVGIMVFARLWGIG